MWILVIVGAIATLASTWFFDTRSLTMHFWLTAAGGSARNDDSFARFVG